MTTLAATSQRERAVASLRHHFVEGRLTAEELADRCERALAARTTAELREALRDLPRIGDAVERARRHVGLVLTIALLASLWTVATVVLLAAWIAVLVFGEDPSRDAQLAFPVLWLGATVAATLSGRAAVKRHRSARRT